MFLSTVDVLKADCLHPEGSASVTCRVNCALYTGKFFTSADGTLEMKRYHHRIVTDYFPCREGKCLAN